MTLNQGIKSGGKKSGRAGGWARRMLQGAVVVAVASTMPAAWSAGGVQVNNVAAGAAAVTRAGSVTTIRTSSQSTIINYQRLSVASGETLQFLQPNAQSRVLNRIQGAEPTVIDGTLLSNGRVYLVNPAGVMFGNGSVINVGALYASAGHISDSDFKAGINRFTDNTGVVRNQGVIQASQIHLMGASVANFGQIVTNGQGIVTMTAGKDVYIAETESPTGKTSILVKVSADKSATKDGTGVVNSGKVDAGGGALYLGAGDLYAAGVYNNGILRAHDIKLDAGANTNVNEGTIDASSATGKGGSVEMVGDKVGVFSGTVDASGATGGGTIKIGGDFHGAAGTPASSMTVVGSEAVIKADALESGDGGQVAVWSDGVTVFGGAIYARGGALGGNGGNVEVSGKQNLEFVGTVNVNSLFGSAGTVLLDPGSITIQAGGTDSVSNSFTTVANRVYQISPAAVGALTGVVVLTTSGDIEVDSSFTVNAGATSFSLVSTGGDILIGPASGNILSNIQITASGTTALTLHASGNITINNQTNTTINDGINMGSGPLTMIADTGNIVLETDSSGTNSAAFINASGAGNVLLQAGGVIQLTAAAGASPSITSNGGNITLQAAGSVGLSSNTSPRTTISTTGTGSIFLSAGDPTLGSSTGSIFLGNSALVQTAGGSITLRSTNLAFNASNQSINAGTGVVAFESADPTNTIGVGTAAGNTLTLSNGLLTGTVTAGTIRIGQSGSQSGAITLKQVALGSVNLEVNSNASAGSIAVNDNGNSTGVSLTGNLTLRAGTGGIVVSQPTNGNAEVLLSGSGRTLTLVSGGGIGSSANRFEVGNMVSGAVSITSTGAQGVFLTGLGTAGLNFLALANAGGVTDVISAGDINGNLSGGISGTSVLLNASGGIGTTGGVLISAATGTLTTAGTGSAGNIHIGVAAGATLGSFTLVTDVGSAQTTTVDGLGNLSLSGFTLAAGDALAVNASGSLFMAGATFTGPSLVFNASGSIFASGSVLTAAGGMIALSAGQSGAGNLDVSGSTINAGATGTVTLTSGVSGNGGINATGSTITGSIVTLTTGATGNLDATLATITADALTLHAGSGSGSALITLTNATLGGTLAVVQIEQDTDLTSIPTMGTGTALTVISHLGNMTFSSAQNLTALTATGRTIDFQANASVSGAMLLTGNVLVDSAAGVVLSGGTNLTVNGSINGVGGAGTLTTNFGGVTTITGGIGNASVLTTVTFQGGTLVLGNGTAGSIQTTGTVAISEKLLLNGGLTISSGSGVVTFGSTVDSFSIGSHSALVVNTSGLTWFQGNVGVGALLGAITTNGGGTTKLGNGGTFQMKVGSPILFSDDILLAANTTLTAAGGTTGTVTFDKTVNSTPAGFFALTISADDAVTFKDNVGATDPLGALVVNATAAGTFLGSSGAIGIHTSDGGGSGSQSFNGPVTLLQDTTLAAAGGATGSITVTGMISSGTAGHFALTVSSAGDMVLAGGTSASAASDLLSIHTLGGGTTKFGSGGSITVLTSGSQTYDGPVQLQGTTSFQGAALTFNGAPVSINAQGFDLTLISNSMTFAGGANSVTGTGHLTLSPILASDNVVIQSATGSAANTLVLGASDLGAFGGFALTTIGRADGTGTLSVTAATSVGTSLHLLEGSGTIVIAAPLSSAGSLGLSGAVLSLGAALVATGGFFATALGAVTLAATGSITTTDSPLSILSASGLVTLNGPLAAGTGAVMVAGQGLTTGAGGSIAGGSITLVGGSGAVALSGPVSGTGPLLISGASVSTLAGATLTALSATISAGSGAVAIGDAVNATNGFTSTGSGIFTLNSGAGIMTTNAPVTITHSSGLVTLNGPIGAGAGAVAVTGQGITSGSGGSIAGGSITLAGGAAAVALAGPVSGTGPLSITGTGISTAVGATLVASSATLNGGAGSVLLNAGVNATDGFTSTSSGIFTLASTGGITTTNAPVTLTHASGLVTLNGPIAAGAGTVNVTGLGITSGAGGTVAGGNITLNAGAGGANINGNVIGTGAVSILGTNVTVGGATLISGLSITINAGAGSFALGGAMSTNGSDLTLDGTILLIGGGPVTLSSFGTGSGAGNISIIGTVNATTAGVESLNLRATNGTSSGNVSLLGVVGGITPLGGLNVSGSSFTVNANITTVGPINLSQAGHLLVGTGGTSTVAIVTSGGAFTATGVAIDSGGGTTNLTINTSSSGVASAIALNNVGTSAALHNLTLIATGTGGNANVSVGSVNLTGAFISSGASFGNSGGITASTITLTHSGLVTLGGDLSAAGGTVSISGAGVSQLSGIVTAAQLTLGGTGTFALPAANAVGTLTADVTGPLTFNNAGALTENGIITHNGSLTLTSGGLMTLNGSISTGTGSIGIGGVGITSGTGGSIVGGSILLLGGSGAVALAAPVTGTGTLLIIGTGVSTGAGTTFTASSATISGGTGSVVLNAAVNATNGFSSTASGIFTLASSGAITTTNGPVSITHTGGLVTINGPISAGAGAVAVTGLGITSGPAGTMTGGSITLAGGAGAVSLGAFVHGTGPLMITGTGVSTAAGATLIGSSASINGGTGSVVLNAAVNATNGLSSTASGIFTLASTGAITTTNGPVSITHTGGLVTLNGPIAAGSGAVTISGLGITAGPGGAITGGSITLLGGAGVVTLGGAVAGTGPFLVTASSLVTTAPITINGAATINGDATLGAALTSTTGSVNITGNVNGAGAIVATLGSVNVGADFAAGGGITAGGSVAVAGNASGGTIHATSGSITIGGTASGSGALIAGTFVSVGGGFSASGGINAGGSVSILGPVTMISGGTITAGSSINLLGGGSMTGSLNAGTAVIATGGLAINGNVTAGTTIAIAGGATIGGTYTAVSIAIPGAIGLTGATTMITSGSNGILLGNIVGTNKNLTLRATSATSQILVGTIGADGSPVGDLAFQSDGLVILGRRAGTATLGGSIFAKNISFGASTGGALGAVPDHATIICDGNLVMEGTQTVTFAQNEKLTVFDSRQDLTNSTGASVSASVVIWGKGTGTSVILGDISTEGRLFVEAGNGNGTIQLQNRPSGPVAGSADSPDTGADIFVLGLTAGVLPLADQLVLPTGLAGVSAAPVLRFIGNVTTTSPISPNQRFQIGTPNSNNAQFSEVQGGWFSVPPTANAIVQMNFVNQATLPALSQFVDHLSAYPAGVRDILVKGEIVTATVIPVVPRDTQTITPDRGTAISGALLEYLREIGINAREMRTDELIEYLLGRGLYDDVPRVLDPTGSAYQVAVNRLPSAPVFPVLDSARKLLYTPAMDEKGNPVMENGKPKMVSNKDAVAQIIGEAWKSYLDDVKAKNQDPQPAEFRGYLEAHEKEDVKLAKALDYLNQIQELLAQIKKLGITPTEYNVSQEKLLSLLKYRNVNKEDFPLMIQGPSTRAGGNAVVTAPEPAPATGPK